METSNKAEQNNTQQKESNMNMYANQIPTNAEDNIRNLKEQLSNEQNAQISPSEQNGGKYQLDSENQNINTPNNIPQNNISSEIRENPQINNVQLDNMPEMNNMNGMESQMNPQSQQINEQMIYQIPQQLQNNQEITINNYLINYRQSQNQPTPEQIQMQQQMELKENKNIYDYVTNKDLYGIAFQNGNCTRLAISSLERSLNNKIEILELIDNELRNVHEEILEYPCTKLLWSPNRNKSSLLATSSDCIQLYDYSEENRKLIVKAKLNNKKSKYCGPLTSFDWNTVNDALLGTASVDTTCTIWDLNKFSIKTQLIAHDKEVFDIQFGSDENTFISGGADGSVRLFDLRSLNHSTIIYETKGSTPINKLAWNLQTSNLIAALSLDKNVIYIFDSRANSNVSMDELNLHKDPVTGIVWAPDNPTQLCSVSEDCSVIISNVHNEQLAQNTNVSYNAPSPINNVDWCKSFPEWIGITFQHQVQLLRK
jgi:WD repeat-containing protein 68